MNIFLKILNGLYRIWFYISIAIATIVLLPFLFIFTIKESHYAKFYVVARLWGKLIMFLMGFYSKVEGLEKVKKGQAYILVANHSSMMDIMLMYSIMPNPFVFVGKQELAKLPVFGFIYKRSSILVDRTNLRSRNAVFKQAQNRIDQGNSVCLFPEGGVPKNNKLILDKFKDGPFRMGIDHQIPILPLVFYDNKEGFPYHFRKAHPGKLRVKIFDSISTQGMTVHEHKTELREKVRAIIYKELTQPTFKK